MKVPFFQQKKKMGLALGGGGARGLAHIGVLKCLLEEGIPIDYIAGTSAGAIVGGMYAAGLSIERMEEIASSISWKDFARFKISRMGMFSSLPIEKLVEKHLGSTTFKDLKIPFVALATDMVTGKGVQLNDPDLPLSKAIRASASFPGVFVPMQLGDSYYVDGGATYNLPCAVVREMGADVVLGVDVIPRVKLKKMPHHIPAIVDRGLDCLLTSIAKYTHKEGDYILMPITERVNSFNVKMGPHLIELGYRGAKEGLPEIRRILG